MECFKAIQVLYNFGMIQCLLLDINQSIEDVVYKWQALNKLLTLFNDALILVS